MNMTRWNPFSDFDDLMKSYQRTMARAPANEGVLSTDWTPSVDITENDQEFLIKAELPEVNKDDISIDVHNGVISLSGERKSETHDEKEHRIERFYGRFSRSFSLPDSVDEDGISADSRDGMLYVHLPKSAEPERKKVKVDIQ